MAPIKAVRLSCKHDRDTLLDSSFNIFVKEFTPPVPLPNRFDLFIWVHVIGLQHIFLFFCDYVFEVIYRFVCILSFYSLYFKPSFTIMKQKNVELIQNNNKKKSK